MTMGNLLQSGLWPGSPVNVQYLFEQEVFLMWDLFRKRMPGTSENAFVKTLEDMSVERGRVSISRALLH